MRQSAVARGAVVVAASTALACGGGPAAPSAAAEAGVTAEVPSIAPAAVPPPKGEQGVQVVDFYAEDCDFVEDAEHNQYLCPLYARTRAAGSAYCAFSKAEFEAKIGKRQPGRLRVEIGPRLAGPSEAKGARVYASTILEVVDK